MKSDRSAASSISFLRAKRAKAFVLKQRIGKSGAI